MNTNKDKIILPVDVIFIPDYIINALNSRGITIADLHNAIALDIRDKSRVMAGDKRMNEEDGGFHPNQTGVELMESKLSKIDREDLQIWNDLSILRFTTTQIDHYTFGAYLSGNVGYFMPDQERTTKTLMSLYTNTMSINNKTFSTYPGSDCLFVILHSGFSNYIINKDNELRTKILKELVNEMVKHFGEERVTVSELFYLFIKLIKN